jgi:hypothetical protein
MGEGEGEGVSPKEIVGDAEKKVSTLLVVIKTTGGAGAGGAGLENHGSDGVEVPGFDNEKVV